MSRCFFVGPYLWGLMLLASPSAQAGDKEVKELRDQLKALIIEVQARDKAFAEQIDALKLALERGVKESQTLVVKLQAENARLRDELAKLKLEAETARLRSEQLATQARAEAETLRKRNEQLLDQIKALHVAMAMREAGKAGAAKDDSNPPPVDVKGSVTKVDGGLVVINLGKDDGIESNQTLEVFRLRPEPRYLGRLRIVEVSARTAIGRMERAGAAAKLPEVTPGDSVASKLHR